MSCPISNIANAEIAKHQTASELSKPFASNDHEE